MKTFLIIKMPGAAGLKPIPHFSRPETFFPDRQMVCTHTQRHHLKTQIEGFCFVGLSECCTVGLNNNKATFNFC